MEITYEWFSNLKSTICNLTQRKNSYEWGKMMRKTGGTCDDLNAMRAHFSNGTSAKGFVFLFFLFIFPTFFSPHCLSRWFQYHFSCRPLITNSFSTRSSSFASFSCPSTLEGKQKFYFSSFTRRHTERVSLTAVYSFCFVFC